MSYPASKNKRKHPRFELFATVELQTEGESVMLPVRNLSLGGVSLDADGHDLGRFADGTVLDVLILDVKDGTTSPVRSPARILRHDRGPGGGSMALTWNATDPLVLEQLATLLSTLRPRKK